MRFLCLHGHGTNSQILEAQLEPLRARLPSDWEFDFLDGEMEAEPALGSLSDHGNPATKCIGIDSVFPGPYVCYHGEPIAKDVQGVHAMIMDVVRDEGPYDGIIAFSQGAAVAATVIAHEAEVNPHLEAFKVAVFLSATMPFDLKGGVLRITYETGSRMLSAIHLPGEDQDGHGDDVDPDDTTDWLSDCRSAGVIQEFQARRPRYEAEMTRAAEGKQSVDVMLRYHPSLHGVKINIPTVHVIGIKDEWVQHGRDLAGICNPKLAQVVTHGGGHQIPRDPSTLGKTAEAIQWAVDRMLFHN